jgi:hypothetical protein
VRVGAAVIIDDVALAATELRKKIRFQVSHMNAAQLSSALHLAAYVGRSAACTLFTNSPAWQVVASFAAGEAQVVHRLCWPQHAELHVSIAPWFPASLGSRL